MVVLNKPGGSQETGSGGNGSDRADQQAAGQEAAIQQPAAQVVPDQESLGDGALGRSDADVGELGGTETTGKQSNEQSALLLNPLFSDEMREVTDSEMVIVSPGDNERSDETMENAEAWSEQKGKGKKKGKRGRPKKSVPDTSGSDTRGGETITIAKSGRV
ncbi:hypothetical protein pipiens_016521 [Culex pipiens pipiens]|uniref:Uncharacterized protein n=1 Tax=Culex pipiens pipiens TaxID=38569 RepID=A0ABD1CKW8_CULPP